MKIIFFRQAVFLLFILFSSCGDIFEHKKRIIGNYCTTRQQKNIMLAQIISVKTNLLEPSAGEQNQQ